MTLQQLRYLIKIVQTGSINLAAQELFLAQPSLSKAMSELEKEMNIPIFVRSHRGVTLTEEEAASFPTHGRSWSRQIFWNSSTKAAATYGVSLPSRRSIMHSS